MLNTRVVCLLLSAVLLGLCVTSPAAFGQEQSSEPAGRERGEGDPARLMGLLDRRAAQLERQQTRLREIRQRLEQGESPAALLAELRERGEMGLLTEWRRGNERDEPRGPGNADDQNPRGPDDMGPEDFAIWRNRVIAFFERHAPEVADRLKAQADTEDSRRAIFRLRREVERLIELRDAHSEEFEPNLERLRNGMRIADVLGKVRAAAQAGTLTEEMLGPLRAELAEVVARQYDAQLESRAAWLARTGRRLQGAVEKLERERAERAERIEAEVRVMLDRATNTRDDQRPAGGPRRGPG